MCLLLLLGHSQWSPCALATAYKQEILLNLQETSTLGSWQLVVTRDMMRLCSGAGLCLHPAEQPAGGRPHTPGRCHIPGIVLSVLSLCLCL